MNAQAITLVAVVLGMVLGGFGVWTVMRSRIARAFDQGKAEVSVEMAAVSERVRASEDGRRRLQEEHDAMRAQATEWRDSLDKTRDETAQLSERASRLPVVEARCLGLEEQLTGLREQAAELREASGRLHAEIVAERDALAAASATLDDEKSRREKADSVVSRLTVELAEANAHLEAEREQSTAKLALLTEARDVLSAQFKNLANDIFEEKGKRFTEQNQTNLGQLLEPLKLKLVEFQGKVEEVYVQEGKDRTALAEQVRQLMALNQSLGQDAKNLTSALKGSTKTQGNWGELVLERVLESSGLRKGEEYDVQESHKLEDGTRVLPDVVIHLPADRHLVVDAKVSLNAYEELVSTDEEEVRQAALKRHLDSVRVHIKNLSDKNYQSLYGLKSLDCVLMFVPIEPAFMLAVTNDRELFMDAWGRNVLLVSPSTLLFVVRTVAQLWRQESQTRNAQDIAKRGAELYDRLSAFVADLDKVGERLKQAQDSYTEARDKLTRNKGNVIRQAEMLKQLGVKPSKALPSALIEIALSDDGEPASV